MDFTLHLVADLNEVWLPAASDSPAMRRLEAFLACFPKVHLTILTDLSLPSALKCLEEVSDAVPDHWVALDGVELHHRNSRGAWWKDLDYPVWRSWFRGDGLRSEASPEERPTPAGVDRVTAIGFLEAQWNAPRPMAFAGNPERDWPLMQCADIAVPVGAQLRAPGPPNVFHLVPGMPFAAGLLDLLHSLLPGGEPRSPEPLAWPQTRSHRSGTEEPAYGAGAQFNNPPLTPGRQP